MISACNDTKKPKVSEELDRSKEKEQIQIKNEDAWSEAQNLIIEDNDFLETREPMSNEAIEPIDYETGLVGDKAYNIKIYIAALERVKKHSFIKDNQVYTTLKSGKEVNIAEDLYDYIVNILYDQWNTGLREGRLEIQYDEKGLIWALPVQKK